MLNFSSDLLNIIGTNEIESFNKTLNEMLVVWNNNPVDGQQQQQQQQQQSQSQQSNQQLRADLTSIMSGSSSYLQMPIPTPSSLLTNSGLASSWTTSSTTTNRCSPPVSTTRWTNRLETAMNQLPLTTFQIDSSKLDELRANTSVLDPLFSMPYNTSNPTYNPNSISNSNINNTTTTTTTTTTNNYVKQEPSTSSAGPMRNNTNEPSKEKDSQSTLVSLSKDQLNTFSSTEMEEYEHVNQNIRELSSQEKKDLKRQKRLIKNRESAHLSRQRKRERLTELEHRVEELTHNSGSLNKALTGLESENMVLKAEVNQLIDVIKDSPVLTALFFAISDKESATATVY
ncbi:putative basic-leucine zipper transcription factor [Heterostelium album PN500]|uniref:Putative basic-leucine zipper transcription factor n=1 Tax=Heterostelium pallidum (strain ATCC 26659 / Pp 5 / PN500) TaxID=670386 RepID=D3B555_HETP5|nr:putative basic-leucine zipper transcription factor [Heterostelium album PN500]EFA83420.1 putative basic-leucine zipper transcription factor [Heterostelium album PN500]|eukprot:XP_020435537.1 putative basic-leucine zipper transcription factor [Heterostelium album PN500]